MRLIPVVAVASILAIPAPAFAQGWSEYASQEDRFTCNFPGEPTVTETTWTSEFEAELPARVYAAEVGPSRYTVTVADYNHVERMGAVPSGVTPAGRDALCDLDVPAAGRRADAPGLQQRRSRRRLGYNNDPALFQQSLGWLDENGRGLRYQSTYSNGFPAPPRVPAVF